jgi:hypothetical protein
MARICKRLVDKKWRLAVSSLAAITTFLPLTASLAADVLALLRAGAVLLTLGMLLSTLVEARIAAAPAPDGLPSTPPLFPLRVFFTLRHNVTGDLLALAFPPSAGANGAGRSTVDWSGASQPGLVAIYNTIPGALHDVWSAMSPPALNLWLDGHSGLGEWPVKRPVEMTVDIHALTRCHGVRPVARLQRSFGRRRPAEVTGVQRCGVFLYQDNDIADWELIEGAGEAWGLGDLMGATVRVRTAYVVSDDDIARTAVPKFHNLHLYFGDASPAVLFFTADQLASPAISVERRPLAGDGAFMVRVLEYVFVLTPDLLDRQLVSIISRPAPHRVPRPALEISTTSSGVA